MQYYDLCNTAANRMNNLNTPSVRTTTYGLKSLKYTGTVLWNNLPNTVSNQQLRRNYANKIKQHFINFYN